MYLKFLEDCPENHKVIGGLCLKYYFIIIIITWHSHKTKKESSNLWFAYAIFSGMV